MGYDGHKAARVDRNEDVRVADDAAGHLGRTGGVSECRAKRHELGGDDQTAGGDHALEKAAAADVFDGDVADGDIAGGDVAGDGIETGHVTLPSQLT